MTFGTHWRDRPQAALLAAATGSFMLAVDFSGVAIAVPRLVLEQGVSLAQAQWITIAYYMVVAGLLLPIGRLSNAVSAERIYSAGLPVFTLGSLVSALAPSFALTVGARAAQGIGAAMMVSAGQALVVSAYPQTHRGRALGLVGAALALGSVVGPLLTGLSLDAYGWRAVFLVNIPFGIVATCIAARLPRAPLTKLLDFPAVSAVSLATSVAILLIIVNRTLIATWTTSEQLSLIGVLIGCQVLFLVSEHRHSFALLPSHVILRPIILDGLIVLLLSTMVGTGHILLVPLVVQGVKELDLRIASLLIMAHSGVLAVASVGGGVISDISGGRLVTLIGLGVQVIGYALMSQASSTRSIDDLLIAIIVVAAGIGFFESANLSRMYQSVAADERGALSATIAFSRVLGLAVGSATAATLWTFGTLVLGQTTPLPGASSPYARALTSMHVAYTGYASLVVVALLMTLLGRSFGHRDNFGRMMGR